ncbi:MAG: T9SS type A sorting domain-containing protein [Candidatus Zixiibacteriota bacterium]
MRVALTLLLAAVVLFPLTAGATIINIPGDYPTIQQGIDHGQDGDTVLVQPDIYFENLNFNGHNVVLASLFLTTGDTAYISSTIIDGILGGSVIRFYSQEDSTAQVVGFTIKNGRSYDGGGIYCRDSSPTIRDNIISGNSAYDWGGGVYCESCSPTIRNNAIWDNSADGVGGGICSRESSPTISDNIISVNSAFSGGGIYCSISSPTIRNNTISGNSADSRGGGIYCSTSGVRITNTILWANTAPDGPEIYESNSSLYVTYCDVRGGWAGQGNIDCDPLFRDPQHGDFQITWENYPVPDTTKSCCIDAGDPNSPLDPDSTRADMGALYFHQYGVQLVCEGLNPVFCRGGRFNFNLIVRNNTGSEVSGMLAFGAYSDYDCDPSNTLVTIRRSKTYPPGVTQSYYFFKVPNAAGPGQYSASVGGTLDGYELFCCMNTDIVQCGPWRMGHNTEWDLVEVDRSEVSLSTITQLYQNYPNPFNATTVINYQLPAHSHVRLEVYNTLGQKVTALVDETQEAGYRSVSWDASGVSSGLYFYRLTAGDYTEARRMMLVR